MGSEPLVTVAQLQKLVPINVRWALQRHYTALQEQEVIFRYGRRILIDRERFWSWLRSGGAKG